MTDPINLRPNFEHTSRRRINKRLLLLIVFLFFTVALVLGYIEYFLARPVGEGPAGPAVDRAVFENVWTEQTIQVVGIGDSITAGLGARSTSHSYFNRLLENPKDEFAELQGICLSTVFPNLQHENFAISGSESCLHADLIAETIPRYEDAYGLVLLTTGGNDLIHSYGRSKPRECAMYSATLSEATPWIENFRTRLDTMLSGISDKFPRGCQIFIADIYDPTDGVGDAPSIFLPDWPDGLAIHEKYNDIIHAAAAKYDHVHAVPLYETFLGHGAHCRQFWRSTYRADDPYYWFFSNVEDPNDRGYDAIRRVFLNAIIEQRAAFSSPQP